jgi:hypothetical protein
MKGKGNHMSVSLYQALKDDYYLATKILDAEYQHSAASLDDLFKTCENSMCKYNVDFRYCPKIWSFNVDVPYIMNQKHNDWFNK